MQIHLDLNSLDDYRLFLKVKSLPKYSFQGRVAQFPDEYAARLGLEADVPKDIVYEPIDGLFDYQRDIAKLAIQKRKFAVFAECGLGKTIIFTEFAKTIDKHLPRDKATLIISPLMVVGQTLREVKRFYGDSLQIEQIRANRLAEWLTDTNASRIGITNYDAITDKLVQGRLGCLIMDECFASGTQVDTPYGSRSIESIKVGDKITNAFGIDRVVATKYRKLDTVVRITLEDGRKIVCSENHPFFSLEGVVQSSKLKKGDYLYGRDEALRVVQQGACTEQESLLRSILFSELAELPSWRASGSYQEMRAMRGRVSRNAWAAYKSILQQVVFSQVANESAGALGKGPYQRDASQDRGRKIQVAQVRNSGGQRRTGENSQSQSNREAGGSGQDFGEATRDWTSSIRAGREWETADTSSANPLGTFGRRMVSRVRHSAWKAYAWLSNLLQGRHRKSRATDCCRSRWIFARGTCQESSGREERCQVGGSWVESVEIFKSGDPEFSKISGGEDLVTLYDLQIENHPSFSVERILVHNSSMLKSSYGKWATKCIELGKGLEYKLALTGTPAPNDRTEYANHALFMDDVPTVNAFLARYFVNKGKTGEKWEVKAHAVEAFYRSMSHWCIFLNNPAVYGWKDNVNNIPPINIHIHDVELSKEQTDIVYQSQGVLFDTNVGGFVKRGKLSQVARGNHNGKSIKTHKPQYIKDLVESWPDESTIIWARYNAEQEQLVKLFPGCANISGDTSMLVREEMVDDFKSGKRRVMVSKPALLGLGLNLQIATRQVFSGISDSLEDFHQAIKRSNRVGSTRDLNVHIPVTEIERPLIENVLRKANMIQSDTEIQERLFSRELLSTSTRRGLT